MSVRRRGLAPPPIQMSKGKEGGQTRTTFKLPRRMQQDFLTTVAKDYGLKGKSRWLNDAVRELLCDSSWKEQIVEGEQQPAVVNDAAEGVYLDATVREKILKAAKELKAYTVIQDVPLDIGQSAIIRAAIVSKIFGLRMPKGNEHANNPTQRG